MPPNYLHGKIYQIINNETREIYIGSTALPEKRRWVAHLSHWKGGRHDYMLLYSAFWTHLGYEATLSTIHFEDPPSE